MLYLVTRDDLGCTFRGTIPQAGPAAIDNVGPLGSNGLLPSALSRGPRRNAISADGATILPALVYERLNPPYLEAVMWNRTILLLGLQAALVAASRFLEVVEKMESDVLELRLKVEELYMGRCDTDVLRFCEGSNYDDCNAQFPYPTCPAYAHDKRLKDFTISTIRIPENQQDINGNPTDTKAIESICFSRGLDPYFEEKENADRDYWKQLGAPTPQRYFGSSAGPIRIYPARHSENCVDYDPRIRPWYSASQSGPKNMLLLLDVSGSMRTDDRITAMKEAAKVIVNTLTVTDRVALIPFSNNAKIVGTKNIEGEDIMSVATTDNKAKLVQAIDELEPWGSTNFMAAFDAAFEVFNRTTIEEWTADCTTTVLFLTDGKMTHPPDATEDAVLSRINEQISKIETKTQNPIFLFTYSVSFDDQLVHEFPKRLACSSKDGVWSRIGESTQIFDSLVGYNRLLALGLGEEQNEDFTAWVEPYKFSSGIWGVTVSAPVYDRSKSPPLFIGVVGVDNTLEVFDRLLLEERKKETFLQSIVTRSAAKCPRLDIPPCVLESYRRQGRAGDQALCSSNCSGSFVDIEEQSCPDGSVPPENVLHNRDHEGKSFKDKEAPCAGNALAIGLGVVGSVFAIAGTLYLVKRAMDSKKLDEADLANIPPLPPPTAPHEETYKL